MSSSREEDLFRKAVAAFEKGNLQTAYDYFLQVVEANGDHKQEAQRYLAEINRQWSKPRRGIPKEVLPMAPPPSPGDLLGGPPRVVGVAPVPELESTEAAAPQNQILRRTPHMDLAPAPPVDPGARIKVSVYTDAQAMREGEEGEDVTIEAPPDQKQFDLTVWLVVGEPFEVEGPPVQTLTILRDEERSKNAEFTVIRKDSAAANASDTGPVTFSALFAYQGRPCGRVSRQIQLAAGAAAPAKEPLPQPGIAVEATAKPADLSVRIVASDDDERLFQCIVQTPLLPAYQQGQTGNWRLPSIAGDFVKQQMAQFTASGVSNQVRTLALTGGGIHLFEASPKIFQKVFWEMIDAKVPLRTISVVTEDPYIPWELMVPTRTSPDGEDEERPPLGVEFLVSRWTSREHILAPQRVPLRDSWVVAPSDSKLAAAQEETDLVVQELSGQRIDPASISALDQALGGTPRTLLHVVCHGKTGNAGNQVLVLEKKEELDASYLRALKGVKKAFRAKPFVFLNACEVGREVPALVGVGGFAEQLMALGASGVIAPLWSVKDSIAHQVAVEFYQRIEKEPETPFAEILRDLRKRSYAEEGGEDTWAAYCFYGDPLAARGE